MFKKHGVRNSKNLNDFFSSHSHSIRLDSSVTAGVVATLFVGATNAMSTVPSMIVTTMKFRSGAIGSLRDPYFKKYRQGLLATTFLLGASGWGTIICSVVVFVLTYIFTFLSVFQVILLFISRDLSCKWNQSKKIFVLVT